MPTVLEGSLLAGDDRVAIVVSRFNELVTERLLSGALDTLRRHGLADDRVTVVHVPGSFELPLAAHRLAHSGQFTMVVCLGAVIQGETTHHEYINHQVAAAIMQASLSSGIPIAFGVLSTESIEQALERAGTKLGNKGWDAAITALEMVSLLRALEGSRTT